jgi:hypothetical protein
MDKWYVGKDTTEGRLVQLFQSSWSEERTRSESGYEQVFGPFDTKAEAQEILEAES